MNLLAELFVRVRGDTTDVSRKLRGLNDDFDRVEKGAGKAHLSTGKLRQELLTLARQVTGVHPIVSQFGGLLTDFAVGGTVGLAVIGGVTAIAGAISLITKSSRDAKKETDDLIKSLEKEIHLKDLGPGGMTVDEVAAATKRAAEIRADIARMERQLSGGDKRGDIGSFIGRALTVRKLNQAYIELQNALNLAAGGQSIINEKLKEADQPIKAVTKSIKELGTATKHVLSLEELVSFPSRLTAMERALSSASIDAARQTLLGDVVQPFDMPTINIPSRDQIAAIRESITHDDENTRTIAQAVLDSAGIIVSALNVGGGGRGSGIGGALGGVAGTALGTIAGQNIGSYFGSLIAPGVGTIVGTVAGSLIGGLFDHKKATDRNTDALNRVANLLNAPTGFKGAYYTYQAEDARRIYRNMEEEARRQTTRGGSTGFALRAGR